jgi:hypothetical protein
VTLANNIDPIIALESHLRALYNDCTDVAIELVPLKKIYILYNSPCIDIYVLKAVLPTQTHRLKICEIRLDSPNDLRIVLRGASSKHPTDTGQLIRENYDLAEPRSIEKAIDRINKLIQLVRSRP